MAYLRSRAIYILGLFSIITIATWLIIAFVEPVTNSNYFTLAATTSILLLISNFTSFSSWKKTDLETLAKQLAIRFTHKDFGDRGTLDEDFDTIARLNKKVKALDLLELTEKERERSSLLLQHLMKAEGDPKTRITVLLEGIIEEKIGFQSSTLFALLNQTEEKRSENIMMFACDLKNHISTSPAYKKWKAQMKEIYDLEEELSTILNKNDSVIRLPTNTVM